MFARGSKKPAEPEPSPEPTNPKGDEPPPPEQRAAKQEERIPMATKPKVKPRKPASEEAVLSRARRMSRQRLRPLAESLGVNPNADKAMDEAIAGLIKTQQDTLSSSERVESRLKALEEHNVELRSKVSQTQGELSRTKRELATKGQELTDVEIERDIERTALAAGVRDTDYGISLFKRHAAGLGDDVEPDCPAFFESLKKSKPFLFTEETVPAGPSPGAAAVPQNQDPAQPGATQAGAPQSQIPDQPAPKPGPSGEPPPEVNAEKMNPREFAEHTRKNYNYTPGQA